MKKSLGQHFLVNKSAIDTIVAALDLKKGDFVVEIGPGEGALTLPLARKCADVGCKILAIEKDEQLVDKLGKCLMENGKWKMGKGVVEVVEEDALKILATSDWPLATSNNWKLVGNIPYYITGQLLRIISEMENKPQLTVLMVQKEVAERVTAKPPKMNLLAAATQIWADVSMLFTLKPKDFDPPPKVESAVIRLEHGTWNMEQEELDKYYKTIKHIFKQPRKTLLNNIADESLETGHWSLVDTKTNDDDKRQNKSPTSVLPLGKREEKERILDVLKKLGFDEKTRGQNLTIEELIRLSKELSILA